MNKTQKKNKETKISEAKAQAIEYFQKRVVSGKGGVGDVFSLLALNGIDEPEKCIEWKGESKR